MNRSAQRGFTLVEIMIVVAIIALLAAIAIPNVLRGRTTANESAAIGNLRALVSSLEMYRSVYQEYPAAWKVDMYTTPDPDFGPPSFNLDLATKQSVQGYDYTYARLTAQTYTITSNPTTFGRTGTRSLFADEAGTIHHCSAATGADGTSPTIDQLPKATCP